MVEYSEAHFTFNEAGYKELTESPQGDLWQYMDKLGGRIEFGAKRLVPKHTHLLEHSINHRVFVDGGRLAVEVGSPLDYALYVHEGTRPHTIHPRTQRELRFFSHGKVVYAREVAHPGTRPSPFLRLAMEAEVRR